MSNQESNNQKSNEIKYYSQPHAESGFLNSLTLVESEHGEDYYAMKLKARRGNSNKPSTAPFSVRINGVQAKEVIAQIADKVNAQLAANKKLWADKKGKEALTILITFNVSDTIAKSYMNKHISKEVHYIDGRCTNISYVRIGDEVIFQQEKETTPEVETPEVETPEVETPEVETPEVETPEVETPEVETPEVETPEVETPEVETPEVETPEVIEEVTQEEPVDTTTGELAKEVSLDPKAENFNVRREELKKLGYSWNSNKKVWSLN